MFGVVFAKSLDDSATGYALTAGQVANDVQQGKNAVASVGTEGCAV